MDVNLSQLADKIDRLLPQTQCGQCGYKACRPYAEAIAKGDALINQCPPGGDKGIEQLAGLLGVEILPLNPAHGCQQDRLQAIIKENACIGCTRCLPPCPVDAIIGASKQMHTVIANECTGCGLCVAECPVDCIAMVPAVNAYDPNQARRRYQAKLKRQANQELQKQQRLEKQKLLLAKIKQNKSASTDGQ
ncbi:MAG: RnfABCDGE type electron transport complex subunit B [Methylococcaceae bacterium]|jgi:electron transport complex protein RnfB|nr:RnfABCDGE type electron transport complex subunit B [Methylococcaceae bacterium]